MIKNEVEFSYFYKNNKLKIIAKLNLTEAFEQLVKQLDEDYEISEIGLSVVADDEFEEMDLITIDSSVNFLNLKIKVLNLFQERKKEKGKEKEKKEIYKERKDREKETEKQKEIGTIKYTFMDVTDEVYVVSKKAQAVLDKIKGKNQKNEDVAGWTAKQFHQYLIDKYAKTYGQSSLEFETVGGRKFGKSAHGIIWTVIKKKLINLFIESGMTNEDLKIYIDWVYDVKSADIKFPVTLNFLCSAGLITEWLYELSKNGKMNATKKVALTSKIHKFNPK